MTAVTPDYANARAPSAGADCTAMPRPTVEPVCSALLGRPEALCLDLVAPTLPSLLFKSAFYSGGSVGRCAARLIRYFVTAQVA